MNLYAPLLFARSGLQYMTTTAGLTALCLTWSWGMSTPSVCSVRTSVVGVMKPASARTRLSYPKQVEDPWTGLYTYWKKTWQFLNS